MPAQRMQLHPKQPAKRLTAAPEAAGWIAREVGISGRQTLSGVQADPPAAENGERCRVDAFGDPYERS